MSLEGRTQVRQIDAILRAQDESLLRIVTCGSHNSGKSTLTGRLEARRFIVADVPGSEEHTRDLVTAASTADCALILVDGRQGILTETRRHGQLVALLGVRDVAVAVNKMDLAGFSQSRFREIEEEFRRDAERFGLQRMTCIPVCALSGDNVHEHGKAMPWYQGPTLLHHLETVEVDGHPQPRHFRMPVQWVKPDVRGYAGTVAGGVVRTGDRVVVAPSGGESTVEHIAGNDGNLAEAVSGQAVTLTLTDELDATRGDVIAHVENQPGVADQFEAAIVWVADEPMLQGRSYLMRTCGRTVTATIAPLKYKLRVDSREHLAADKLERGEIGVCELELSEPIAFDPYAENRETGGFTLIDRITSDSVGAGLIHFALRRSHNVRWQAVHVNQRERAISLRQHPTVLWFTGVSGAGKSTIADLVEAELHRRGHHTYLLDGDNVRHGLSSDLGFTTPDRVENVRRVSEVSKLMVDAGLIVIVSFISPFKAERAMARSLFDPGEFVEIYVDTPLAVAEQRDPKGLYGKARRGELVNFTGIDSPYEPPDAPELHLRTTELTAAAAARTVLEHLERAGRLGPPAAS